MEDRPSSAESQVVENSTQIIIIIGRGVHLGCARSILHSGNHGVQSDAGDRDGDGLSEVGSALVLVFPRWWFVERSGN